MLGVESGVAGAERVLQTRAFEIQEGRSGKALAVQLFPAFAGTDRFRRVGCVGGAQFGMHQPCGLRKERHEKQSSQELRTAEALAGEIWTHRVEPSVLPWRRLFAEKLLR